MTWQQPVPEAMENPDNIQTILTELKSELSTVQSDLASTKKQRDDILSGNNELLKSKVTEIDSKLQDIEQLRVKASEQLQAALQTNADADKKNALLDQQLKEHDAQKENFAAEVNRMAAELDSRELAVKNKEDSNALVISQYHDDLTNLIEQKHQQEAKEADLVRRENELSGKKSGLTEDIGKNNELLSNIEAQRAELVRIKEDSDGILAQAMTERQKAESMLNDNLAKLSAIEKANENALNIKIENKKILMQTEQRIKIAMKQEEDATAKIAELKILKEEVSK